MITWKFHGRIIKNAELGRFQTCLFFMVCPCKKQHMMRSLWGNVISAMGYWVPYSECLQLLTRIPLPATDGPLSLWSGAVWPPVWAVAWLGQQPVPLCLSLQHVGHTAILHLLSILSYWARPWHCSQWLAGQLGSLIYIWGIILENMYRRNLTYTQVVLVVKSIFSEIVMKIKHYVKTEPTLSELFSANMVCVCVHGIYSQFETNKIFVLKTKPTICYYFCFWICVLYVWVLNSILKIPSFGWLRLNKSQTKLPVSPDTLAQFSRWD